MIEIVLSQVDGRKTTIKESERSLEEVLAVVKLLGYSSPVIDDAETFSGGAAKRLTLRVSAADDLHMLVRQIRRHLQMTPEQNQRWLNDRSKMAYPLGPGNYGRTPLGPPVN